MTRRTRIVLALAVALVMAVVVGGASVLLETRAGLRWAVGIAEEHSGGALHIGSADGRLAGPLELRHIRFRTHGATLAADRLRIEWRPLRLLTGRLSLTRVEVSNLRVDAAGASAAAKEPALPERIDLPLAVHIGALRVHGMELRRGAARLHLDRLALALAADSQRLRIAGLRAEGPELDLAGNLDVRPYGNWAIHSALRWTLRAPGYPKARGATRIDGRLRREVRLVQTLTAPFDARLSAEILHPFHSMSWQSHLEIAELEPRLLHSGWPAVKLAATLTASGNLHRIRAQGTVLATGYPQVDWELDTAFTPARLAVHRLALRLAGVDTRLQVHGVIKRKPALQAELTLAWQDLRWPLQGVKPRVRASRGEAQLTGNPGHWQAAVHSELAVANLPGGQLAFAAAGSGERVLLENFAGRWLGGTLSGNGRLELAGSRAFDVRLSASQLDASRIEPGWNGTASFALAVKGTIAPLAAKLALTHLRGRYNSRPLDGAATVALRAKALDLDSLRLALGPDSLRAHGRWKPRRLRFAWRIDAPDLAALATGLGGKLNAAGTLTGSAKAPRVAGRLTGRTLQWQSLSVASAEGHFDIALEPREASTFALSGTGIERGRLTLSSFAAELAGPPAAQHFSLTARGPQASVEVEAAGALGSRGWRGRLLSAQVAPAKTPPFFLERPAALTIGRGELELARSCWGNSENTRLCLQATSDSRAWALDASLSNLPLAILDPYVGGGLRFAGVLSGSLHGRGGGGQLRVNANASAQRVELLRRIAGERRRLRFVRIDAHASADETVATASLDARLENGGTFKADASTPWRRDPLSAGTIHLQAHVPDLSGLDALSTELAGLGGRLDADLTLQGERGAFAARGSLDVADGSGTWLRTGTRIRDARLTVEGTHAGLDFHATASDGGEGRIGLTGAASEQAGRWTARAKLTGNRFLALDMPEARARISPDLELALQGENLHLDGTVIVPGADIKPPDFSGAVAPTPDLVVVGRRRPAAATPLKLYANIALRLGEDVRFAGFGLTARIGGSIRVHDAPETLTTASGELKVLDGNYQAYGQKLHIDRGRLLFSGGPIDNPGLDVRATRTIGTVVAGLDVTGTLRNPTLRVFSDPAMSQSNALAYLLFGHGVQQASGSEQSTLNQAAGALGIAGGAYIVRSVGKHVGIETVSVENASPYSTSANQASLFLGRYLSPRVYVSYGMGLFAPINLFRVRYELSRHWAIEAESGTFSGADILYNIEH